MSREIEKALYALAEKEGATVILGDGTKRIDWHKLMLPRRGFDRPVNPKDLYTEEELALALKLGREQFVTLRYIAKNMGIPFNSVVRFVVAKGVPVYEIIRGWPGVWAGDFARALSSSRIDMNVDGGLWKMYLARVEAERVGQERKKRRAAQAEGRPR
jgi:hypothetical protein